MKRIELSAVQVTTLIDTLRYASHQMKLGVDTGADKEVVDELTETLLDFFKEGSFDCVLEKYVFWCPGCPDEDNMTQEAYNIIEQLTSFFKDGSFDCILSRDTED